MGNVTEDSELTFEYGIRRKQKPEPVVAMETEPELKIRSDPELEPEIELIPADTEMKLKELGATCEYQLTIYLSVTTHSIC